MLFSEVAMATTCWIRMTFSTEEGEAVLRWARKPLERKCQPTAQPIILMPNIPQDKSWH